MKEDIPRKKRTLSREEMLSRHRRRDYQDTKNELDDFSRRALSGLQYHPEEEPLEQTLHRLGRKLNAAGRNPFPFRRILSIAAAAVLLLSAGYFLFLKPPSNEALFAQHFDYLPSAVHAAGGSRNDTPAAYDQTPGERNQALRAYEAGQYEQAQMLMEQHLAKNSRDTEIRFYLGIVLLGEGQPAAAIEQLDAVLANLPQPAYKRPAQWYLGLAHLRNGQREEAKAFFEELLPGKDRYATDARAALQQM